MDLRAPIQSMPFTSSISLWRPWHRNSACSKPPSRVHYPVCQVKSALEQTPKELHHMRKKEEWKKKRRVKKLQMLAEAAGEKEKQAGNTVKQPRKKQGLTSFEKFRLDRKEGSTNANDVWRSGKKEKTTIMSKFEEEFAKRVKDAVSLIRASNASSRGNEEDDRVQDSTGFRENSELGLRGSLDGLVDGSDDWLLAYGHSESTGNIATVNSITTPMHFIDHSFRRHSPIETASSSASASGSAHETNPIQKPWSHKRDDEDTLTEFKEAWKEDSVLQRNGLQDWRIRPKSPKRKDKSLGQLIRNRRKGEPLSQLMDMRAESIPLETYDILEVLREDVDTEVQRRPVDEREQLEWLVEQLSEVGSMQKVFLSRLMHAARMKWTEGRLLELVKMLGERRNWRRAMEVVHWVHCREHFKHCRSRHVCTTLLAVLGKCLRPAEALNVFNVMREEYTTYPDLAAYHCVAVTLGKAGHLTQLLELIESLKEGPKRKHIIGNVPKHFNWDGTLQPDIVVYNAVINACGPHRQWKGTEWVLQQMKSRGLAPNSATYGLAIEVMVKSGQLATAWKLYESMESGGFLPNALTFKALVEALGTAGETDKAVEMVEDMERRGVLECAGVYYALASALCSAGRWSEALVQVEKLQNLPSKKPDVITYTGLIRTCEKAGRWQDAISLFQRMQYVCAPNVGTYNIMIALYGRHRMFEEAQRLYEGVKKGRHTERRFHQGTPRLSPDVHTYESMLGACAACEQWEYFENVFEEILSRGFELDCHRHTWLISPLVKAGQEKLINLLVRHLRCPDGSPSTDVYRLLLTSLHTLGQHTLVLHYLDILLKQGVALDIQEWAILFGMVLERLPMVDVEHFICTKLTPEKADDNTLVKELLHCLIVVGAATKAERVVSLLGVEAGNLVRVADMALGDSRLLPQDEQTKFPSISRDEQEKESSERFNGTPENASTSVNNDVSVKKQLSVGGHFEISCKEGVFQHLGGKVLCSSRIDGWESGWKGPG